MYQHYNHSSENCTFPHVVLNVVTTILRKHAIKSDSTLLTCCNCGGSHPASYRYYLQNPKLRNKSKLNSTFIYKYVLNHKFQTILLDLKMSGLSVRISYQIITIKPLPFLLIHYTADTQIA